MDNQTTKPEGESSNENLDLVESEVDKNTAEEKATQSVVPKVKSVTAGALKSLIKKIQSRPKVSILAGAVFLLLVGLLVWQVNRDHNLAVRQFSNIYSFVPEKISKSAPIPISVPEGISEDVMRSNITFSPEIKGEWVIEELDRTVVFKPRQPLSVGKYYAVNLDTETAQMSGDFYVDEDPQIQAIFPVMDSESHEDTEITIVFNRPMVPLTTLIEQESVPLTITISPPTPGKFKWISTRNLQFIPETTLVPSSDYVVAIKEGLFSVEGLSIAPVTHKFFTRPLRYEYFSEIEVGYRSPMVVVFNQPVDLDKTKKKIKVTTGGEKEVAIEVEYGENNYYDEQSKKYVTEEDRSRLFIYQKKDVHGRNRLWDFDTVYDLSVDGAVPLRGNKLLEEGRRSTLFVSNVVQSITALSDKTELVRQDLLDPEGSLAVTFYEEIDLKRSDIRVKGLKEISYGEKCQTDDQGEVVWSSDECKKVSDKKSLVFYFKAEELPKDDSFLLELRKLVTTEGLEVNANPIDLSLRTYPGFTILHTGPTDGEKGGAIDGMRVCSNTPLQAPGESGLASYVKANDYIVYGRWSPSRYIASDNSSDFCNQGEFETELRYGLLPETAYTINLSLIDSFGQRAVNQLAFRTRSPESKYAVFSNMQNQYNVTTPDRTKLTYATENLEYVDMHICRLEPEDFIRRVTQRADYIDPPRGDGCSQVVQKRIDLPKRYWVYNYFQVDLKEHFAETRGHYIITFTNPLLRDLYNEHKQIFDRTYVSVTNLAVGVKEINYVEESYSMSTNPAKNKVVNDIAGQSNNLYWVSHSQNLNPVAGASVTQFFMKDDQVIQDGPGYTNYEGVARVRVKERLVGSVIRSADDTAVVSNWADVLLNPSVTWSSSRTYVYTDRPIYRPGQTVYIKGIDRIGFDGKYEIWNQKPVKLEVIDAMNNKVHAVDLPVNDYGTFSTEFQIPTDGTLGHYRIEVLGQSAIFAVEEYVPSAFKLEAETDKEEYMNGDQFKVNVQADYYFGVPLSEGTISYSVTAQDYYFDRYTDDYFNFGNSWYYCYSCGYGDDFLFRGEVPIGKNGQAVIEREINFKELFAKSEDESSKLITLSITAKDSAGRSVSTQKSFIVHKSDFYLGAVTSQYYTGINGPINLRVKTVDVKGQPMALTDISRTAYKVNWETYKRQEVDGGFYYRSEKKLQQISNETIKTNKSGDWSGEISFAEAGEYEIHVSKQDSRGVTVKTISNIYIYGEQAVAVEPNNNYSLDLEVQSTTLKSGDTASLLIKSPYQRAKALITIERGTLYDYKIVDVVGGLHLHEFPVKDSYAPNVFASVLLLANDPEVKFGMIEYNVDSQENNLLVSVKPSKTFYLPGEEVTLTVETKNHAGQPVPAEVSIAVADLSVLALKGNPKKSPARFFYDGFPLTVSTASNIKNILYEVDVPLGTKGGGGSSPDDLSKKQRGIFKDTAYWEANVLTGSAGRATVSFTLPDNLTTWQIESLGVTKDTKLGVDYQEFTTKKDLMAVPLKPRFVVPGDKFLLGAKVFNQTDRGTKISVSLQSDSLVLNKDSIRSVFVETGEAKTVYFEAVAPVSKKAGTHSFTFTASDDTFVDSVVQTIPITPNSTYETTATANFTKADVVREYLYLPKEVLSEQGGLTINANATLAVFMSDALSYMVTYPYGCSEQMASALSTIAILTTALDLPNVDGELRTIEHEGVTYEIDEVVKNGLSKIYQANGLDGGFAYYENSITNPWLTMHVVTALTHLKKAGFEVREDVIQKAIPFIESEILKTYHGENSAWGNEAIITAEYVLRTVNGDKDTSLTSIVRSLTKNQAFLNEKISTLTLSYLSILTAKNYDVTTKKRVYDALKNRIDIDGRGAYLRSFETTNQNYYENPIKNTALLLKVFSAHNDEHPDMANVLRWLLASRDKAGAWGGTHNTFTVVEAMVDYLEWQGENESHFALTAQLGDEELFKTEFNPTNVFKAQTYFIPTDSIRRNTLLPLIFNKKTLNGKQNNLYYDIALKYYLPVTSLPPRDEGITINRELFQLSDERSKNPIKKASVGEVVRGKITVTIPDHYTHVAIEDMIPAGFEIVNFNLATEDQSLRGGGEAGPYDENWTEEGDYYQTDWRGFDDTTQTNWLNRFSAIFRKDQIAQVYRQRDMGGSYDRQARRLYPDHVESHDDRVFLFKEALPPGVYEYEYFLRALIPGEFQYLPARAEQLFFPEVFGRTSGDVFTITEAR